MTREQEIKQQGIDELWLSRQGLFKWRISLGLIRGKEQANKTNELFSKQTDKVHEVVPSMPIRLMQVSIWKIDPAYVNLPSPPVSIGVTDLQGLR